VAFFATQLGALLLRGGGHLTPDVAAEQVPHSFSFFQAIDHRVEPALQLAKLGAIEYHHIAVQVTLFDVLERRAHHPHWRCGEP
jgi:hypothetical protein